MSYHNPRIHRFLFKVFIGTVFCLAGFYVFCGDELIKNGSFASPVMEPPDGQHWQYFDDTGIEGWDAVEGNKIELLTNDNDADENEDDSPPQLSQRKVIHGVTMMVSMPK